MVIERDIAPNVFKVGIATPTVGLDYKNFYLGWGLQYDTQIAPEQNIILVRGNAATPAVITYNGMTFEFSLKSSSPIGTPLDL